MSEWCIIPSWGFFTASSYKNSSVRSWLVSNQCLMQTLERTNPNYYIYLQFSSIVNHLYSTLTSCKCLYLFTSTGGLTFYEKDSWRSWGFQCVGWSSGLSGEASRSVRPPVPGCSAYRTHWSPHSHQVSPCRCACGMPAQWFRSSLQTLNGVMMILVDSCSFFLGLTERLSNTMKLVVPWQPSWQMR